MVPALVLGEGNTALGALRALGRAGIPCYAAPPAEDYVARSRWYRPWPGARACEPSLESLVEILDSSGMERAVLIPGSDPWVRAVSELPTSLAARFPGAVPGRVALDAFVDKGLFADLLDRLGVAHPRTVRLRAASDVRTLPADLLSRGFLKPADSYAFQRRFGRKALHFSKAAEGERLAAAALAAGLEVMVQEYLPGPATEHYFIDGFVDRTGCPRGRFARRRVRMWPRDFGNSSALVSVSLADVAPAVTAIDTLLSEVGYRGIFSAEFKRDPRDGALKILEVNARVWKFVDFAAACGVDVCTQAWRDALGLPVETVTSYRIGARCVDAYFDRPACLEQHRRGALGLAEWAGFWLTSRPVTFAWDDPVPWGSWLVGHLGRDR